MLTSVFMILPTAKGTTYDVGAGKTYANLEALRQTVNTSMWADDDEIVLYGDDNSLTDAFNFGGKRIFLNFPHYRRETETQHAAEKSVI